jgi:biotin-[acetyl-CoA-carboxylase] ligase BirA-like protein
VAEPFRFDGLSDKELALLLDVPAVELMETTSSTLDVAHKLGSEGGESGTLILADHQSAGRGRSGSRWASASAHGIWLTLLERPVDTTGMEVLALRIGLRAARALDRFTSEPVRLKWPNDLYVEGKKLGGVLIEARWREQRLEWVAIGIGINVTAPADVPRAAGLEPGSSRLEVLTDLIPGLRAAASSSGNLTPIELIEWNARDMARGHHCVEPARGVVEGITAGGELLVALADSVARFRAGSLILDDTQ